jgi:sugar O-acyltransferase (sialic acid O-acetyltransferase NeuD family)
VKEKRKMILGILGAGGLARELLELAKIINSKEKRWEDFVFIDVKSGDDVNGVKVFSCEEALEKFRGELEATVGIGEPAIRERVFGELERDGIEVATLIHPDVYIPDTTTVGKGVVVQMGAFVSCNVTIEDYVIIQPHANIAHDDVLRKGSTVSAFCNLGGNVTIGEYAYLGLSACVKQGLSVGGNSIVGMGAVVCESVPDEVVVVGNPARPMKKRENCRLFS